MGRREFWGGRGEEQGMEGGGGGHGAVLGSTLLICLYLFLCTESECVFSDSPTCNSYGQF